MSLYISPFIMPSIFTSGLTQNAQSQTMIMFNDLFCVFWIESFVGRMSYILFSITSKEIKLGFVASNNHIPKIGTFVNMPSVELKVLS